MAAPDFYNMLSGLGDTLQQNRARNTRERTLAELGQGANVADVSRALFQAGDIQGGLSLANLANAQNQQDWQRTYQGGMLNIAKQNVKPEAVKAAEAAGLRPGTPEFTRAVVPKSAETPISATDKRAIFEAEDAMPALKGTIDTLARAKELNNKTFSGAGASYRAWAGSKLPDFMVPDFVADKTGADATTEWQNIMSAEAIKNMAETLKGATTNFELQEFQRRLADPSTPPEIRGRIIDRMMMLAERQRQISEARMKDLRGGTYFKPEGAPQTTPAAPQMPKVGELRDGYRYKGGNPADPSSWVAAK